MDFKLFKIKLLAIVFFASISLTHSQTFSSVKLDLGIVSSKPIKDDNYRGLLSPFSISYDPSKGFYAEGMVFIKIFPSWEIGTGIGYMQTRFEHAVTGIKTEQDILDGTITSFQKEVSIDFIGVPIKAKYSFEKERIQFNATTGVALYKTFPDETEKIVLGGGQLDPVIANLSIGETSKAEGIKFATSLGAGVSYFFSKNDFLHLNAHLNIMFISDDGFSEGSAGNMLFKGLSIGYGHKLH